LASRHAEREVKVNTDVSIILCGAVVDLSELVIRICYLQEHYS
jgi:hypothetical protein